MCPPSQLISPNGKLINLQEIYNISETRVSFWVIFSPRVSLTTKWPAWRCSLLCAAWQLSPPSSWRGNLSKGLFPPMSSGVGLIIVIGKIVMSVAMMLVLVPWEATLQIFRLFNTRLSANRDAHFLLQLNEQAFNRRRKYASLFADILVLYSLKICSCSD